MPILDDIDAYLRWIKVMNKKTYEIKGEDNYLYRIYGFILIVIKYNVLCSFMSIIV